MYDISRLYIFYFHFFIRHCHLQFSKKRYSCQNFFNDVRQISY